MTPYVSFQEEIIRRLHALQEKGDERLLRDMAKTARSNDIEGLRLFFLNLQSVGMDVPEDYRPEPWVFAAFTKALEEQIDDSGDGVVIRNLLGTPLYGYGRTVGLEQYLKEEGSGNNRLRTEMSAQPGALKVGDILATGCRVLSEPREGGNGSVLVHLTGGTYGHWIDVPARIPIALSKSVE